MGQPERVERVAAVYQTSGALSFNSFGSERETTPY